ncbi:MAG: hypothetical protein LBP92_04485 [Deltaproteobacteria bacterium]|jgi:hypothetical protein|nr:hypothetical protein [Deltaproteobacteria bacterium]
MSEVSSTGSVGSIASSIDLGTTSSLQLMFAKLQLALSGTAKSSVMGYIEALEKSQAEQKEVADFLTAARGLQAKAKSENKANVMPDDMVKYMNTNNLAYDQTGKDNYHNKDEWELAITSLKTHLDVLGTDTQQKMVFVQDFMGQYNSYLQGANSATQQSNQTLAELDRLR